MMDFYTTTTSIWVIQFYLICPSYMRFLLKNLTSPEANYFKFIHKVKDHTKKTSVHFGPDLFFHSGSMPLFTLAGSKGINFLWTHSFIFFLLSVGFWWLKWKWIYSDLWQSNHSHHIWNWNGVASTCWKI